MANPHPVNFVCTDPAGSVEPVGVNLTLRKRYADQFREIAARLGESKPQLTRRIVCEWLDAQRPATTADDVTNSEAGATSVPDNE